MGAEAARAEECIRRDGGRALYLHVCSGGDELPWILGNRSVGTVRLGWTRSRLTCRGYTVGAGILILFFSDLPNMRRMVFRSPPLLGFRVKVGSGYGPTATVLGLLDFLSLPEGASDRRRT